MITAVICGGNAYVCTKEGRKNGHSIAEDRKKFLQLRYFLTTNRRDSVMGQWIKISATNPEELNSFTEIHITDKKKHSHK